LKVVEADLVKRALAWSALLIPSVVSAMRDKEPWAAWVSWKYQCILWESLLAETEESMVALEE
jgi:hypothetical protein